MNVSSLEGRLLSRDVFGVKLLCFMSLENLSLTGNHTTAALSDDSL